MYVTLSRVLDGVPAYSIVCEGLLRVCAYLTTTHCARLHPRTQVHILRMAPRPSHVHLACKPHLHSTISPCTRRCLRVHRCLGNPSARSTPCFANSTLVSPALCCPRRLTHVSVLTTSPLDRRARTQVCVVYSTGSRCLVVGADVHMSVVSILTTSLRAPRTHVPVCTYLRLMHPQLDHAPRARMIVCPALDYVRVRRVYMSPYGACMTLHAQPSCRACPCPCSVLSCTPPRLLMPAMCFKWCNKLLSMEYVL